jgi:serine/threonine protein kinase
MEEEKALIKLLDQVLASKASGEKTDPNALVPASPELARQCAALLATAEQLEEFVNCVVEQSSVSVERDAATVTKDVASTLIPAPEVTTPPPEPAPSDMEWPRLPGYEIIEELGRAGMGIVYKAKQVAANRLVALKMIRTGVFAGQQEKLRFRNEAQAAARFRHPNLVCIYEVSEHNGLPYFSMELGENGSLEKNLAGRPLPPDEAARLLQTLADAVHYAHENNIVHRDLKPANVVLTADGRPLITDFGLAKRLDSDSGLTSSNAVLGTASYMAPEQAAGHSGQVGPTADIYALGAILYELLTGRAPFKGATVIEILLQVVNHEPVAPTHLRPDVPPDLETVCLKCLEKQPDQRYASARDLADDLKRYLAGESVNAASLTELERQERWARQAGFDIEEVMTYGVHDVVYKAREVNLNRVIALKIIADPYLRDPATLARLQREAETVAQLEHPNIVRIYTSGTLRGRTYLTFEFVPGGSLVERFLDQPVPPRQAAHIVQQLAQAMHYAHQRGVLHCALKPSNVLLSTDGEPKVTNFSLSALLKEPASERALSYRLPTYTAPELVEARAADIGPATDVYGLGAILYQLLTGSPPFQASTLVAIRELVRGHMPALPSTVRGDIPPVLDAICQKCLAKEPAHRFQTARELAEALKAAPMDLLWGQQGADSALREFERTLAYASDDDLRRSLEFFALRKEPGALPVIFRCLARSGSEVRSAARAALFAYGWESVMEVVEGFARNDAHAMAAVLDGLNAFEAHPRVVALLDRLIIQLKGEMRNRALLLLERKRLGLDLDKVAALFREIRSPYRIQKVLGQGLFTDSYLAQDETTGLEVVVRVLRPEFANQPAVRAQFLDLTQRSVYLVHDKLALTREARAFPDRNVYFAVRDYIPGVTLQRVLEAGKRFEPLKVFRILRSIAEALIPIHRKALCHGGIKPSNIFLCEGDTVVLGDLTLPVRGIGLALDRLAYDYRYAAPEMFGGAETVGPVADFYALGCVAYELICGVPPFVSDNFNELAASHLYGSIILPSKRAAAVGRQWDDLVAKLLARLPRDRAAAPHEVVELLAHVESAAVEPSGHLSERVTGEPLGAHPVPHARARVLGDQSIVALGEAQSVVTFDPSFATGPTAVPTPPLRPGQFESLNSPADEAQRRQVPKEQWPLIPSYEILELLGQGGMGAVYKARHIKLDRVVALKLVPAASANADQRARFRTEAQVVARLSHPNIVQIYELLDEGPWMCLALEYVAGDDLNRRVQRWRGEDGQLPLRTAAELMVKIARSVHFAHQQGVIHRDLKPANILLTPEGEPKIADFGLAKMVQEFANETTQSAEGLVVGTPTYMAPEQWQGAPPAASMDVYALGVMLYEMVTGRRPFRTTVETAALMYQTLNETPESVAVFRSDVPPELDAICRKPLQKDPALRYGTAAALADDLEHWLRGEPVTTPPTTSMLRRLFRRFSF